MRQQLSTPELLGAAVGLAGGVLLALGAAAGREAAVTVVGDLAATAASVALVGYLLAGRQMRKWMPIFVYAFPVTAVAGE